MECRLCNIYNNKELLNLVKLYEDDICIALLSKKPFSLCHVIVYPKKHYTIIEQMPDKEAAYLFNICNNISKAIFESLNIQGTNIFIQNGIAAGQEEPHFCIHIISRQENDGIKLDWAPRQLSEEEMSTIELQYKEFTSGIVFQQEESIEKIEQEPSEKEQIESSDDDEENYMLKYFDRRP